MPMATNPDIRGTGPSILIGAWGVNLSIKKLTNINLRLHLQGKDV